MRHIEWCVSLMLLAVACGPSIENEGVRGIIEETNAKLIRWYDAGQMDSVASVFAPDARQIGPNVEPLVGREAIREFWTQVAGQGNWRFTLSTEDVVAEGRLAVERGTYTVDFVPGAFALPGMLASTDTGNYLVHWRLDGQRWMIVNDVATSQRAIESICLDLERSGPSTEPK